MAIKKKTKISNVKRSQHLKNKKSFAKPLKKKELLLQQQSQQKSSKITTKKVFGKPAKQKNTQSRKDGSRKFQPSVDKEENEDDNDTYENIADMIDEDDVELYRGTGKKRKKPAGNEEDEENAENTKMLEKEHAITRRTNEQSKKRKVDLLPIKNKSGEIIERSAEVEENENGIEENDEDQEDENDDEVEEELIDSDDDVVKDKSASINLQRENAISTADLLILREQEISRQKFRIGIICSGILEKPEDKMKNFSALFEMMDERCGETKNLVSIRKIAALSLLEVFKDILPEYRVGQVDLKMQTVRKNTMERITYEETLLQQFKRYLQKLEKTSSILTKKHEGGNSSRSMEMKKLALVAVTCLCELLIAHPHFNFSQNIAQLLVYLLNSNNRDARARVQRCFEDIFTQDKKLELSLFIVRRINHLIKSKSNNVHTEMISCLLALPIKSINLDAEKEAELKQKKLEAHRARLINMSKKEKKRHKRLAQLDKQMQETKAEENKQTKHYKLTEITKMIFTIYFRILKNEPNSQLLSVTLEGLAKFAHAINLEFFSDLVEVLNGLMENSELGYREQLHCIQTVFTILSGQGEALNIDPLRFYGHLYRNLLVVHAGKNHEDFLIILKTLGEVLIKRRKNITQHRLLAFVKRILTLSMQLLHNGTLGCLGIAKQVIQLASSLDIILDTDTTIGSGRYDAELDDPEYCNADCTALYELCSLTRHYHPVVRKLAKHIAAGVPATGEGSLNSEIGKLNPIELYEQYDSSLVAFNPAIPAPKSIEFKEIKGRHLFLNSSMEEYCRKALSHELKKTENLLDFRTKL